jgi:hypothetical protein
MPTGLKQPAQGCEERATLGKKKKSRYPEKGWIGTKTMSGEIQAANLMQLLQSCDRFASGTHGSSFLATLGDASIPSG